MATLTAGFIETSSHGPENAGAEKRGRDSSRRDACRDGGCLSVGGPCVRPVLALVFGHFGIGLGVLAFRTHLVDFRQPGTRIAPPGLRGRVSGNRAPGV